MIVQLKTPKRRKAMYTIKYMNLKANRNDIFKKEEKIKKKEGKKHLAR